MAGFCDDLGELLSLTINRYFLKQLKGYKYESLKRGSRNGVN